MDDGQFIHFCVVKDESDLLLTVQTVSGNQTLLKNVPLPPALVSKDQDSEDFGDDLLEKIKNLLKTKGAAVCEAVAKTGSIPNSLC
jgi:hypothetical protein